MSIPPLPGKGLSVKVDQQLYDDLTIMMRAGNTVSDAVKEAVSLIAGTYRNAWAMGAYPEGVLPQVIACQVRPYDRGMTPEVPAGVPEVPARPGTRVPVRTAGGPVPVRTGRPSAPIAWMDPAPLVAAPDGHLWVWDSVEPASGVACKLCGNRTAEPDGVGTPCPDPHLLAAVNEERAAYIALHRITEGES